MSHDKLVQDASVPVSEQPTRQSALYDRVAEQTASMIIREYSTSFGLAARLLGKGVRQDVENIYGLVRLADEIVDGVAAYAGVSEKDIRRLLDELEVPYEDEGDYVVLMVSSRRRDGDPDWVAIGSGSWDHERRDSYVRLDRVLAVQDAAVRREGAALTQAQYTLVLEHYTSRR